MLESSSRIVALLVAETSELSDDYAAIAQLVERIHGKDEVSGSSPDRGSKLEIFQKPWRNVRRFLWCSIK